MEDHLEVVVGLTAAFVDESGAVDKSDGLSLLEKMNAEPEAEVWDSRAG